MEKVWVIDFGSQYTLLLARRARELGVYAEVIPHQAVPRALPPEVKGLILSGSYASAAKGPALPTHLIGQVPILAICYSAQWLAAQQGGQVMVSQHREYGPAELEIQGDSPLFARVPMRSTVWMSHSDTITSLPAHAHATAATSQIRHAAYDLPDLRVYAVQFHPEVSHTAYGIQILENFLRGICGFQEVWRAADQIESLIQALREAMPTGRAVCALSGGIDSTVAALLAHRAIGERFLGFFVDTGLLRKDEREAVLTAYQELGLPVQLIKAEARFIQALAGVTDPEEKRKRIGHLFIDVFAEAAQAWPDAAYLIQGTIYPDVVESGAGVSALIKSHHNVGGLPDVLPFHVVEPLRYFFKDEVRQLGAKLGLSACFLGRHPFPGPGLAVRILGEVTAERLALLREADAQFIHVLRERGWYDKVWQAFAVLLPIHTVGVAGDSRQYGQVIALRAVLSEDGMTARAADLPFAVLEEAAQRILETVPGITRVVYDLSPKPPATIEWE